jgi:hypothetical protein
VRPEGLRQFLQIAQNLQDHIGWMSKQEMLNVLEDAPYLLDADKIAGEIIQWAEQRLGQSGSREQRGQVDQATLDPFRRDTQQVLDGRARLSQQLMTQRDSILQQETEQIAGQSQVERSRQALDQRFRWWNPNRQLQQEAEQTAGQSPVERSRQALNQRFRWWNPNRQLQQKAEQTAGQSQVERSRQALNQRLGRDRSRRPNRP